MRFVRRPIPAVPFHVALVVGVVTRFVWIEPVPEVWAFLPLKVEIELQHHCHVVLVRRGECDPNEAGHVLLKFISRDGQAESQNRVLPSPFMPIRAANSPAFSGAFQKMRYFGSFDAAGAACAAGEA